MSNDPIIVSDHFSNLTPHYRLYLVRQCKFKTAAQFATSLKTQASNYSRQEKGTRPLSTKMITKYCNHLGASIEWVKKGTGVAYPNKKFLELIEEKVRSDNVIISSAKVDIKLLTAILTEVETLATIKKSSPNKKAIVIAGIYEEVQQITPDEEERLKLVPSTTATFIRFAERLGE